MPTYELNVETDPGNRVVRLRLTDGDGAHRGARQVKLREHSEARWEGLFDTRRHVERYQDALRDEYDRVKSAEHLLEELGVFLGNEVLGPQIMGELHKGMQQRTLLVRLPATEDDVLAAAFARVPWEIARPAAGQPALMERNLVVRVITQTIAAGDSIVHQAAEHLAETRGAIRVLVVFAEAPGSRPLAMRLERERLRRLFEREILPRRNVEIDMLCHGVTRDVLRERITARGGYHVVHWVGHGHHNRLELMGEDGKRSSITGDGLVELIEQAGGFVPQLLFLSACLSGTFVGDEREAELRRVLRDDGQTTRAAQPPRSLGEVLDLDNAPGYTGTALALLRSGVPQVVAMRYSVGDDYARELAWWFYKRLLADPGRPSTEAALALARADVRQKGSPAANRMPVDHANPLIFGQEGRRLEPAERRSKQMRQLRPQPQPLLPGGDTALERPALFVGRERMLTRINRAWQPGDGVVTVIQGMRGLGKTSLAAEALHLWFERFDWVLAFRTEPGGLAVEAFLRQVDERLTMSSVVYRERCEEAPLERVHLEPGQSLTGEARYERMRTNLVEALRDEAVLLVLDGFERNLEEVRSDGGYACADPQWDALLRTLAEQLPGTRSRVLVTTLHRPRALAGDRTLWLAMGPLSWEESVLYVRSDEGLSSLLGDDAGCQLLERVLKVADGHPGILEWLAARAGDREGLGTDLSRLETEGLQVLPGLAAISASEHGEAKRAYLEEMVRGSVDVLLERVSMPARRLLWMVSLADEPVAEAMLTYLWVECWNEQPAPEPVIVELYESGLLYVEKFMKETSGPEAQVGYGCHGLVREQVAIWVNEHPEDQSTHAAEQVWMGYGQCYASAFESLYMSGTERVREAAAEVGRRALVYSLRARDYQGLRSFAGKLITGTSDPGLLGTVIAELRTAAAQLSAEEPHWSVRTYLADALSRSGFPGEALALYHQAATEAEQAEDWADAAWILGNWANALRDGGMFDASKTALIHSAEASHKASLPRVHVVASELEGLRIDVMQGKAIQVLPDIEIRLQDLRGWWEAQADGPSVSEAPDREVLGRVLISGLDIAKNANLVLERWQRCLDLLGEIERIQMALGESEYMLARIRLNRYGSLLSLGRVDEAGSVLENCLAEFRKVSDLMSESKALSGLAELWYARGDLQQATDLQRQAVAICNILPDIEYRACCHNNLSSFLECTEQGDATDHRLAALVYYLVIGQQQHIPATWRNLARGKHRAASTGMSYDLPRLVDILARPTFEPLRRFLADHRVPLDELQAALDDLEARAVQAAQA